MDITKVLKEIVDKNASDIFIVAGKPLTYKANGILQMVDQTRMLPNNTAEFIQQIYAYANRDMTRLTTHGDDDFSFTMPGVARFRISSYKQRSSLAGVIRVINFNLPEPEDLKIPDSVMEMAHAPRGMVLVTGPAGGGKSTTLACIIDKINRERACHIITLEDPLEFLHSHNKSIVSQREINSDSDSYLSALRSTLRQSPDVILLGEMRDYETINTAITAAETGHLLFSTLHTIGASNTIDRIIDVFPASQQRQISIQLASVLHAVVSQKLLPSIEGPLVPAFEIMTLNPAIRNLIREGKIHQIDGVIYSNQSENMIAMDTYIYQLFTSGIITKQTALTYANNPEMLEKRINKN